MSRHHANANTMTARTDEIARPGRFDDFIVHEMGCTESNRLTIVTAPAWVDIT